MKNMGLDFKAPRQDDVAQWKKVEILYRNGYAYHSCGCGGPGERPRRLQDVDQFLKDNRKLSKGEMLLERFEGRAK